jgi:methionyl-tRNA formyltransferase
MRGFTPWPGTFTGFRGQRFHIWKARPAEGGEVGVLRVRGKQAIAGCGHGTAIELVEVQLEGRKRMSAQAFLNGNPIQDSEVFTPC